MKLIYIYVILFYGVVHGESDQKKNSHRDVNDAESIDYTLAKIPVYVIPNTPPVADGKIPVAVIPNAYPVYVNSNNAKEKPLKYGFYAPYKTPKVTPIHEPQNEGYVPQASDVPLHYPSQDLYHKRPEYELQAAYKVPVSNGVGAGTYVKFEQPSKAHSTKQQNFFNGNAYAAHAPVYSSPNTGEPPQVPPPRKYNTYDPENNVHIQYIIKYVPVPYTVSSGADQYHHAAQPASESAYITPKPYAYKEIAKKPHVNAQPLNTGEYVSSTENYVEYAKYAESYTPSAAEEPSQYPTVKTYVQPHYKHYDKNAYTKKFSPTSYVLASIGKSAPTHYAASIRHDRPEQDPLYTTKLAPVPLPVDKYTAQDNYKSSSSAEDTKVYSESDYSQSAPLYSLPGGVKYKSALVSSAIPQFYNVEYGSPIQYQQSSGYQKKDVSASISSPRTAESSTEKQS